MTYYNRWYHDTIQYIFVVNSLVFFSFTSSLSLYFFILLYYYGFQFFLTFQLSSFQKDGSEEDLKVKVFTVRKFVGIGKTEQQSAKIRYNRGNCESTVRFKSWKRRRMTRNKEKPKTQSQTIYEIKIIRAHGRIRNNIEI